MLREQTNSATFGIDRSQDAIYLSAEPAERLNLPSANNPNIAKAYEHAENELVVELGFRSQRDNHHFIFSAIPFVGLRHFEEPGSANGGTSGRGHGSDWNDDFVLLGITNLIECPRRSSPPQ